jgi:serine/threonine protein kinase
MSDFVGKTLGPYKLEDLLGKGGMATVYRAYQTSVKRYVAIKVMAPEIADQAGFIERFAREAEVIASLEHPHILPVIDYGTVDNVHYLVMRYIEGGSLDDRMRVNPLTLKETSRFLSQIGSALSYAHRKGVIHRDLKPNNVLLDSTENAYLTDFGIARLAMSEHKLTTTGSIMGTPAYMSPEQGLGNPVDARSDIYTLGVVLYEMVLNRLPFAAETPAAMIFQHVYEKPKPPEEINPSLPAEVVQVLHRGIAKDPADRFQSANELAEAFADAIAGRSANLSPLSNREGDEGTFVGGPITPMPVNKSTPAPNRGNSIPAPIQSTQHLSPATTSPNAMNETIGESGKRSPLPLIIAGVIALLVLVGGGAFVLNNNNNAAATAAAQTGTSAAVVGQTNTAVAFALSATKTPTATPTNTATATVTNTATTPPTKTPNPTLTAFALMQDTTATAMAVAENKTATMLAIPTNEPTATPSRTPRPTITPEDSSDSGLGLGLGGGTTGNSGGDSGLGLGSGDGSSNNGIAITGEPADAIAALVSAGELSGNNGELVADTNSVSLVVEKENQSRWIFVDGTEKLGDFVVAAAFSWDAADTNNECGFLVRYTDASDNDKNWTYYLITLNRAGEYVAYVRDESGFRSEPLLTQKTDLVNAGNKANNHLLIIGKGNQFTVFVNGHDVATFKDSTYEIGSIALVGTRFKDSAGLTCRFRNVWAWKLD